MAKTIKKDTIHANGFDIGIYTTDFENAPEFKLYVIKDYQRLKHDENSRLSLSWNLNREISKLNYGIHTDAIKNNLIPYRQSLHNGRYPIHTQAKLTCSIPFYLARRQKSGEMRRKRRMPIYVMTQHSVSFWFWQILRAIMRY